MARPKVPLHDRIDRLTTREMSHLMWSGIMHQGKPFMKGVGNPARVLLRVDHPNIQVRNQCGYSRCIDPFHQRVICETSRWFDDRARPVWHDWRQQNEGEFNERELAYIQDEVQSVLDGDTTLAQIESGGGYAVHVLAEMQRRIHAR